MGKTKKGAKGCGYEYWSKRKNAGAPPGRISKKITSGKERMEAKKIVKKAKEEDAD